MTKEKAIADIIENAKEMLQWHLDDYGYSTVNDVKIDELGWGENAVPIKMLRAYQFLNKSEGRGNSNDC